jgi:hypothetical protein
MASQEDPGFRYAYAIQVSYAWLLGAFAFMVAMLVLGVPARELFGVQTGKIVIEACLAGSVFCLAGGSTVVWRMYYFVPKAKRLVSRGETDTDEYARIMRATLPRNSSLIFLATVAIAAFLRARSSW